MTAYRSTPVSQGVISWLLTQSQAQRGRETQLASTCPTFADWVAVALGAAGGAGRVQQLLRVPYPEPTAVTITIGINNRTDPIANAVVPKLYGYPFFTGVTPGAYQTHVGTVLIEWILAGSVFSAMVDLGPNVLSIPACDQVTVSYFAHLPAGTYNAAISVAALPGYMPGAVATLTRAPVIVPAGGQVYGLFRSAWARRWKLAADVDVFAAPPVAIGPLAVQNLDAFNLADSAECVNFADLTATVGIPALQQGWIESAGPSLGYVVNNLGGNDVKAKIIEQVQVS